MNFVREFVEGSYTSFKADLGVSGMELMEVPMIIIAIAFVIGAGYTIARTLSQIHINNSTFIQKDFLIGSGFFALAGFNAWAIMYMDIVLNWYTLQIYGAYAASILWVIPAIAGMGFFESWKNLNLKVSDKTKIINQISKVPALPSWVLPVGSIIVMALMLFGMIVFSIEYNMNMDCSRIGTGEDSRLTEDEAIQLRESCESMIDSSYIFEFLVLPIMALAMVLYIPFVILRMDESSKSPM